MLILTSLTSQADSNTSSESAKLLTYALKLIFNQHQSTYITYNHRLKHVIVRKHLTLNTIANNHNIILTLYYIPHTLHYTISITKYTLKKYSNTVHLTSSSASGSISIGSTLWCEDMLPIR